MSLEPNQWEVALVDIQFPNNWYDIVEFTSIGIAITNKDERLRSIIASQSDTELFQYTLTYKNINASSPSDLLDILLSYKGKQNGFFLQ